MNDLRVEAVGFIDHYCAVYRRDGIPDELLVDADGKPLRFASATTAIRAGKAALVLSDTPSIEPDILGVEQWRQDRSRRREEERTRVFGDDGAASIVRNGREVVIERKRR